MIRMRICKTVGYYILCDYEQLNTAEVESSNCKCSDVGPLIFSIAFVYNYTREENANYSLMFGYVLSA